MSIRTYEKEEKQAYVEDYKNSGESLSRYALEKGLPATTLRGWIKEDKELTFGAIEIKPSNEATEKVAEKGSQKIVNWKVIKWYQCQVHFKKEC